ncbi:MAG: VWA domain-containing protein [Candidatus Cryptobacteroides sp.]
MTTEQKIQVLREDFLGRNEENYTNAAQSGRLGWEQSLSSGSAYSAAMLSPKDDADLHRIAYNHARDMIVAMNTPFKVRIALTPDASYTDSKVVSVATDMFDDGKLSVGQKIDIFTGLAIHEGSHLLYTDFDMMPQAPNRVIADLFNIIEDERIEMLTGQERPGLANFLGCVKYYYFDRHSSRMAFCSGGGKPDRSVRLVNSILSMIRYPKALEEDDLREFADTLYEVRDVILPYPQSCAGAFSAAQRIYDIIKRFFNQEQKNTQKSTGGSGKGEPGKEGGQPSLSDEQVEELLEKVLDSLEKDVTAQPGDGSSSANLNPRRMSGAIRKDGGRLGKALEGELEIGATEKVNIHVPKPDRLSYEESLSRVRRYVPAFSSILRRNGSDRVRDLRGLRSGFLDTCKLAEAVQGVENIYRQDRTVRADRMAVCILVDESGSMDGEKIQAARDTAILLNEALATVRNVDLYIYGHTTEDGSFVKLNAYREGRGRGDKFALGSIDADWSNIDSRAIREAAARVRARTREKCLFFVISDGEPCEPTSNVKAAVRELSRDGFSFVSIGIDFEYDPSEMYDNHVSMTDLSTLAPELGKMIKKAIIDNSKRQ